jgi:predicted ribosome quality control (RQC) complex YloA/Tae2 family protein
VSNAIRYDALLARDLAVELHAQLSGARVHGIRFDREALRAALLTRAPRRSDPPPPSLLWQLHPDRGHLTRLEADDATGARVAVRAAASVVRVTAPPDERIIDIELDDRDGSGGATRRLIIELITNQWNAIAVDADDVVIAVLRELRGRTLRPGERYEPPPASHRQWSTTRPDATGWAGLLRSEPPGRRLRALMQRAAYTSSLNAPAILGDADVGDDDAAIERARERYLRIVHDAPRSAVLLAGHTQPYPVPLSHDDEPMATLLDAFTRAAEHAAAVPAAPAATDVALAALAERVEHIAQRLRRLDEERTGAEEEAQQLRQHADLLLSQLHRVPRGASSIELDDFHGGTVVVALDPSLGAAENATGWYDVARKRSRAAARIPALLAAGERERTRLLALGERIRAGTASPEEIAALARRRTSGRKDAMQALPYRTYRTTGGIEVRVGRGARANDELTFHHAQPTDIWLHARDVAGAHVILRWSRAEENPPARDLSEAAVLAALHSRARTSGTVAVDWTRRKYVRKPRKSGPGAVVPERVRTIFVEPDPGLAARMREEEG